MKTVHAVEVFYTKVVEYFVGHSLAKVEDFWTFRLGNMTKKSGDKFKGDQYCSQQ